MLRKRRGDSFLQVAIIGHNMIVLQTFPARPCRDEAKHGLTTADDNTTHRNGERSPRRRAEGGGTLVMTGGTESTPPTRASTVAPAQHRAYHPLCMRTAQGDFLSLHAQRRLGLAPSCAACAPGTRRGSTTRSRSAWAILDERIAQSAAPHQPLARYPQLHAGAPMC